MESKLLCIDEIFEHCDLSKGCKTSVEPRMPSALGGIRTYRWPTSNPLDPDVKKLCFHNIWCIVVHLGQHFDSKGNDMCDIYGQISLNSSRGS